MGFRKIGILCYCQDPECPSMFTVDPETRPSELSKPDYVLPCGHKIDRMVFSATHIKGGDEACDMIDWLMDNGYIKSHAFDDIEEQGGKLDDGLNLRVPR